MIDIIKTIFLGIIQGITEWLPISSTGHLILFSSIWPLEPAKFFEVFKVVIQFGSILAVLVLYEQKLNPFDSRKSAKKKKQTLQLWSKVIVGVIPCAIIGLLLDNIIEDYLSKNIVIAITLILYGMIFISKERKDSNHRAFGLQIGFKDWLFSMFGFNSRYIKIWSHDFGRFILWLFKNSRK